MAVVSRYVPVDLRGRRVVIAGAGIAGLAAALALGERGAEVCLVDSDPEPAAANADDAFFRWSRRRVPQTRHSHAFLARLRMILRKAYPEFYAALLAEGARELRLLDFPPPTIGPLPSEPGDEDLAAIGCRRTTFEWVLRRYVAAQPWINILSATSITGLIARDKHPPEIRGVYATEEDAPSRTIAADFVVDATGRNSRAPQWLAGIGAPTPDGERSSSSILYYTRFYRLRPGKEFPAPGDAPTMVDFGWIKFAIFPADHSTFSITFAAHLSLPRLKALAHPAAFDLMARSFPGLAPYADPAVAEPISVGQRDVLAMGGLENCLRRFVDRRGLPLARGFFAIGDSAYHTNPLYGRGATQAFMHAGLLGEALDATAGDVSRAATLLDEAAREEIEPFYRASVVADAYASRKVGAAPASLVERLYDSYFENGVLPATRVDPVAYRAFVRMMNMIETPEQAFFAPAVLSRVIAVWLRGQRFRERIAPFQPDPELTIWACERAARSAKSVGPEPRLRVVR